MFSNIDNWGHLGGMISGFCLGFLILDTIDPPVRSDKYIKISAGTAYFILCVTGLACFYTLVTP
jgi:Rhomboid family